MNENILQFLWSNRLFSSNTFITTSGKEVKVIDFGQKSKDAGADFTNAKVQIDDTLWAGNIEIHVNAGDWYKHKHDTDPQYNTVILHVVHNADKEIQRQNGETVPCIEIDVPDTILEEYEQLSQNGKDILCTGYIEDIDPFTKESILNSLVIDRLQHKTEILKTISEQSGNNKEQAFLLFLAAQFGMKVNALPFELLIKSIPYEYFAKINDSAFQTEALLFGQSGLLQEDKDKYSYALLKEYYYLQKRFKLSPIDAGMWKFLRIRPNNFPTIKIAQFAQLLYKSQHLFSKIIEKKNIQALRELFSVEPSEYWETHYQFGTESPQRTKAISAGTADILIINAVIPALFLYGEEKGKQDLKEYAFDLLSSIDAEKNAIISRWQEKGFVARSALHSQALLELYNNYCTKGNCLHCRIGQQYLLKCYKRDQQ